VNWFVLIRFLAASYFLGHKSIQESKGKLSGMGLHAFRGISLQESKLSPFHLPVDHHGDQMCRWFVQLPHFRDWCQAQDTRSWYLKDGLRDPTGYHNNNCMTTTNTGKIHHHDHRHWLCKSLADFCMSLIDARFLNRWWFLLCEMIPQIWVWLGSVCSSANEIELKNDTFKRYLFSRLRRFFP
jgi:hypothetical protein